MSQPGDASQASTSTSNKIPKSEPALPIGNAPTVVVIPSNVATAENILTGLKTDTTPEATAPLDQDPIDATDLTRDDWLKILTTSSVLKAWKGSVQANEVHVNRAPCPAIALKSPAQNGQDPHLHLPVFEIADYTYIEIRESKSRLEREMTLKAFTETGIHAALSGGASGVELGLGTEVRWQNEQNLSSVEKGSTTAIHGFYNFPRVVLHLLPDTFEISPQSEQFFTNNGGKDLKDDEKGVLLQKFNDRFGAILPTRVTLGGRLCTTQEVQAGDSNEISQKKKDIQVQLAAMVKATGAGLDSGASRRKVSEQGQSSTQADETSRMVLETQGGNGLLTSTIDDWRTSVASHRYWRAIQQEQPEDLLTFLAEITAGTATGEHVNALAHYARVQKLRARELNLQAQKVQYLEISADIKLTEFTTNGLTDELKLVSHQFAGTMHISQPNALWEIRVSEFNYPWKEDYTDRIPRGRISSDVAIQSRVISDGDRPARYIRLSCARNLAIYIELEHYLSWGEDHVDQTRRLEWPDLEAHPKARWRFPMYYRKLQSTPQRLQDGEEKAEDVKRLDYGTKAESGDAASSQSQKTPNIIKKIMNH